MKQIWEFKNGTKTILEGEFPYKHNDIVVTTSFDYNNTESRFIVSYGFWRKLFNMKPILKQL